MRCTRNRKRNQPFKTANTMLLMHHQFAFVEIGCSGGHIENASATRFCVAKSAQSAAIPTNGRPELLREKWLVPLQ